MRAAHNSKLKTQHSTLFISAPVGHTKRQYGRGTHTDSTRNSIASTITHTDADE